MLSRHALEMLKGVTYPYDCHAKKKGPDFSGPSFYRAVAKLTCPSPDRK